MKPLEFTDVEEFRQIKLLVGGLILHPSLPLHRRESRIGDGQRLHQIRLLSI
jgi:hypothetical protein